MIPKALTDIDQWVCWRLEDRKGKPTKVPYQPNGRKALTSEVSTWYPYRDCISASGFNGVGFVFSEYDPFTGIDVDNCIRQGRFTLVGATILGWFAGSYAEVSPSGNGIKIFTRGRLTEGSRNRTMVDGSSIEIYDQGRYFTVTGQGMVGYDTGEIASGAAGIQLMGTVFLSKEEHEFVPIVFSLDAPTELDDSVLIKRACFAKNGAKFNRLYSGDTTGYPSGSEADSALVALLSYWTKGVTQIDRLFRMSGLMRNKWDEVHHSSGATYGEETINRVLKGIRG